MHPTQGGAHSLLWFPFARFNSDEQKKLREEESTLGKDTPEPANGS